MNGGSCGRNGRRVRRGGVYLAVLGVSMLVTLIGLSGVLATRVRQRTAAMARAAAQADTAAQAFMDVALFRLTHDLYWRINYQNDTWTTAESCGDTTVVFKLVDELDGNLANDHSQPARLYTKATVGEAMRMYSVVFSEKPPVTNNLLLNPGMESGTSNWYGFYCSISSSSGKQHSGAASLKATSRTDYYAGPAQTISSSLESGQAYEIEAWVQMSSGTAVARIVMYYHSIFSGDQYIMGGATSAGATAWTRLSALMTPSWSGSLTDAYIRVSTESGTTSFYVDDVIMREAGSGEDAELTPVPGTFRREVLP
jgi:hypothetical protein